MATLETIFGRYSRMATCRASCGGTCAHSMGGNGALTIALRRSGRCRAVSALSPIVASSQLQCRQRALPRYRGDNPAARADYDACKLVRRQTFDGTILIDQGEAAPLLESQRKPEWFDQAGAEPAQSPLLDASCDHRDWFITSFIDDRVRHHAEPFGLA